MSEPKLVYIEWTDAVGNQFYATPDTLPVAITLRGYTTLIEEAADHIVVAHFPASDGGFMGTVAIPLRSIIRLDFIAEVRRAGAKPEHAY